MSFKLLDPVITAELGFDYPSGSTSYTDYSYSRTTPVVTLETDLGVIEVQNSRGDLIEVIPEFSIVLEFSSTQFPFEL